MTCVRTSPEHGRASIQCAKGQTLIESSLRPQVFKSTVVTLVSKQQKEAKQLKAAARPGNKPPRPQRTDLIISYPDPSRLGI